jgi:hypothetical protein
MEFKLDITFDQLLQIIRQLPDDKKLQILAELSASQTLANKSDLK